MHIQQINLTRIQSKSVRFRDNIIFNFLIPPGMINNTVVALSKDRMCTVFWDEKTMSFESAEGIYTVAKVADITTSIG